jgi:hypothetical protein
MAARGFEIARLWSLIAVNVPRAAWIAPRLLWPIFSAVKPKEDGATAAGIIFKPRWIQPIRIALRHVLLVVLLLLSWTVISFFFLGLPIVLPHGLEHVLGGLAPIIGGAGAAAEWVHAHAGDLIIAGYGILLGLKLDGNTPAVVHGYGGFGVSLRPRFNPSIVAFLRAGGVYALANVRGGGEFGGEWHRAGARENKQTAIDDFNAAATWLISAGFTKPSRLASYGWSNGGMLANAAAQQQPGLWRAVVAGAPVADMARFHLFHSGRHWISEYGSPDIPEELAWLLRYSPCHNMPEAIEAPAVLLVAPDEDDRVAPWHSYKLLALWQASSVSGNPVLLLGEQRAGHRGGAAIESVVAREANIWSFLFWQLGVEAGRGDSR